jgi:hypothetical protein
LPEPFFEFKVELDILFEVPIVLHAVFNLRHVGLAFRHHPIKKPVYDAPFHVGEDVGPHLSSRFPFVGKGLSVFPSYSWKRRLCASAPEAKKSTRKSMKEEKSHGKT